MECFIKYIDTNKEYLYNLKLEIVQHEYYFWVNWSVFKSCVLLMSIDLYMEIRNHEPQARLPGNRVNEEVVICGDNFQLQYEIRIHGRDAQLL